MSRSLKRRIFNIRTGLCVIFLICSALLFLYVHRISTHGDQNEPQLFIAGEEMEYTEGEDLNTLLSGTRAEDDVDGDVTDSIRVRSIYYIDGTDSAMVTYVAKDSSNNVGYGMRKVTVRKIEQDLNEDNAQNENTGSEE